MLGLCDRFHCLPSAVYDEDVSVLRLMRIEALGKPREEEDELG